MQLTRHTDYALRLLMQLAAKPERRMSIADVAAAQGISHSHLMKVANELAHAGFIKAVRGRGGGISLGRPAEEINIGAVLTVMEPGLALVNCCDCALTGDCGLPAVLAKGVTAFVDVLSGYSLADILR